MIQKAAHENANIIFGAVQDDNMKDTIKITVIAAGFKDANKKNLHQKPSFLPKTWKAGREIPEEPVHHAASNVVHQVQQNVREVSHDVPADDLDVPTFLRRHWRPRLPGCLRRLGRSRRYPLAMRRWARQAKRLQPGRAAIAMPR